MACIMARRLVVPKTARSEVWNYFGFEADESGTLTDVSRRHVWCRLCDSRLLYSGNTTNLSFHIARCRKIPRVPREHSQSAAHIESTEIANLNEESVKHNEDIQQDGNKMRMASDSHQQVSYSTNNEEDSPGGNATVTQEHGSSFISSGDEQHYCVKWKFHQNNQQTMFAKLLQQQRFCDVTIACEGKLLQAHKLLLSACSSYFEMILSLYEHQCPIIILKDVRFEDMSALIQFMYKGEINIEESQLQSLLETADHLKIKGLSDIYGKCLDEHSEFADKENVIRESQDTKIDQSSEDHLFDPGRTSQAKRRAVSIPEDEVLRPVKISRRNIGVEVAHEAARSSTQPVVIPHQNASKKVTPTEVRQLIQVVAPHQNVPKEIAVRELEEFPSHHDNHTNEADYMEGIIRLPDFLKGHGTYQEFWKKPWVVRALKAVNDREITLRTCSGLLGVAYSILYSRYRLLHGCLKEGSVESPGTICYTLKIVKTPNENEERGKIVLMGDHLSPAAAFSVADQNDSSSGQEEGRQPILNVKLEPMNS